MWDSTDAQAKPLSGAPSPGRVRPFGRPLTTTLLCLALTGCGLPLYLHKDAYQKETSEIKESVDKLDVESAYAALRADMIDLAKAEDRATLASLIAARNQFLTRLIDPGPETLSDVPDAGSSARERLNALVSADLCALYGSPGDSDCSEPAGFDAKAMRTTLDQSFRVQEAAAQAIRAFTRKLSLAYRELASDAAGKARLFDPGSGKNRALLSCPNAHDLAAVLSGVGTDMPQMEPEAPTLADTPEAWDSKIDGNNEKLVTICIKASEAVAQAQTQVGGLAGLGSVPNQINIAASDLAASIERAERSRQEAIETTNKINEYLRKAEESAANAGQLSALMKEILATIDRAAALSQAAGYDTLLELTQCGLLADLRATLPADGTAESEADGSQVKVTTKSVEATSGGGVACIQGISGINAGDDGQGNTLVVSLAKLLVGLKNDKEVLNRLERVTATVLAGVQLRHKRDLAVSRVQFEKRNILLLRGKLHALLTHAHESRIALLENAKIGQDARGFAQLRKSADKRHVGFALNAYAQSWDHGKIPVEILNYRLLQARRAYDTEVAGLNARNYRDLIKPLTDALAAYGAGGITPEMIGQILGNAAIAVGIAKS